MIPLSELKILAGNPIPSILASANQNRKFYHQLPAFHSLNILNNSFTVFQLRVVHGIPNFRSK